MDFWKKRLFFVLVLPIIFSINAYANSISLQASEDVLVNSTKVVTPGYYQNGFLSVYYDGTVYNRSYLKFDLSGIPDVSVITQAYLWLYDYEGLSNPVADVHHVSDDSWTESATLWSNKPSYDSKLDSGSPVIGNWIKYDLLSIGGWNYSIDLADNTLSLLLKEGETSTSTKQAHFYASDYDLGHTALRPRLDITYVPEPSTLVLIGIGMIALVGGRLKRKR
jgi:hypothetical protein